MTLLENDMLALAVWIVVALGALNWGLVEFVNFDLLKDGLGLAAGSTEYRAVIGVIGAAGLANLIDLGQRIGSGSDLTEV